MLMNRNEVHIWRIDDTNPSLDVDRLSSSLTPEEWERHDRFVFERDRRRFLMTRAMVREVLSRYRPDIAPRSWRFTVNDYGKPRIDDAQCDGQLHFNIAHTSGAIVFAVRSEPGIGIDIECLDRGVRDPALFESVLTARELQPILALPASQQVRRFYTFWTLKEAYTKAVGKGLSIPLTDFGFDLCDPDHPSLYLCGHEDCDVPSWRFHSWDTAPNHIMALAFKMAAGSQDEPAIKMYQFC